MSSDITRVTARTAQQAPGSDDPGAVAVGKGKEGDEYVSLKLISW